jgi:hypothetical protein
MRLARLPISKTIVAAALSAFAAFAPVYAQDAAPLLKNPGFEAWDLAGADNGWQFSLRTGFKVEQDCSEEAKAPAGKCVLKITGLPEAPPNTFQPISGS